jgi:hypothetical protein
VVARTVQGRVAQNASEDICWWVVSSVLLVSPLMCVVAHGWCCLNSFKASSTCMSSQLTHSLSGSA